MAAVVPPLWLQAGSHPAEVDRNLIVGLTDAQEGILIDADLAVSQRGAGANMSVDVAAGRAFVKGDTTAAQGIYLTRNDDVVNLAIAAADATNPRIDIVIAEVRDAGYSGASNDWRLRVVTGTPAASPVAPATPDSSLLLANVAVAALASSITNANITDKRSRYDAWRKPLSALANAPLSPTSAADIPGATITFTTIRANVTCVVWASFDIDLTASTVAVGTLVVDGSTQTNQAVAASGAGGTQRASCAQIWVVILATAASHTLKLQGTKVSGTTATFAATHTSITIGNFF